MQTRVTNVHGKFFILVPTGTDTACISKPGYTTVTKDNITSAGKSSRALALHFALTKSEEGDDTDTPSPQQQEIQLPGSRIGRGRRTVAK